MASFFQNSLFFGDVFGIEQLSSGLRAVFDTFCNFNLPGKLHLITENLTLSRAALEKALHALFSFIGLKPSVACKSFALKISPNLIYFLKSDFKSWDNSPNEKYIYNFVNYIWKCITKRQIWQVELNLTNIL